MIKTRFLLASVLKPISDTRMYEKLGLSLAKIPGAEVHIAGFTATSPPAPEQVKFYPIFNFKRLSPGRLLARVKFIKLLWQVQPQVLILGSHELMLAGLLYNIFKPVKLVYDIRENYYLNLTTQYVYPKLIGHLLARLIRLIEKLAAPFIDTFFLAEKSYATELPFLQNKYLILQNKYRAIFNYKPTSYHAGTKVKGLGLKLLYSGTISRLYGIFDAIALTEKLNQLNPLVTLSIVGYCPQEAVWQEIKNTIQNKPFIKVIGGDTLVSHGQIIEAITQHDVGLLPYHAHPSLWNCIPTKLYEYLANGLPVIIPQNPLWQEIMEEYQAGLAINFKQPDADSIYSYLTSQIFYTGKDCSAAFWQPKKLNSFIGPA